MEKPILAAMLSCSGLSLTDAEKRLFSRCNPLGVSPFGRNIASPRQLRQLVADIKTAIGRNDVLIGIDQEGGRVRRLSEPDYRTYASQYRLGQIARRFGLETGEQTAAAHALLISQDLYAAGINWNYAPVIDVCHRETSAVLRSRTFGSDRKIIAALGQKMVDTYIENGICPCIKHLPGLGSSSTDPHLQMPVIALPLSKLQTDFRPFKKLRNSPAGMTAHIMLPEIDSQYPLTQSAAGISRIIRGELGFAGFLISDAVDMHALRGSLSERVQSALTAGCDCVCYCGGKAGELEEVAAAAQNLRDNSLFRFEKIQKIIHNKPVLAETGRLAENYEQQIGRVEEYNDDYDATETLNLMQNKKGEI